MVSDNTIHLPYTNCLLVRANQVIALLWCCKVQDYIEYRFAYKDFCHS